MLADLIARFRAGEFDLDGFAKAAAAGFVRRKTLGYPEDQGNEATIGNPSAVSITVAVREGDLTQDEADAIYAALPRPSF